VSTSLRLVAALSISMAIDAIALVAPAGTPCADLASLTIPDVRVAAATDIPAGPFRLPGARADATPATVAAFCRVIAVATPTPDSHINLEVWIPEGDTWNGKFQGVGTGGFQGAISYAALAAGVNSGYATASTDTGHTGDDLVFGSGHREKIIDWAHRSIHLMTEAGKLIVRDNRGRFPAYSYFNGCATGGHQAMMEVQRFPQDYDGVVAGNPAADRTNEIVGYLWAWLATHRPDGTSLISVSKLQWITRSAVAQCDALDGVKDGVIDDPRRCTFDPASLSCRGADAAGCLTPAELAAVRKVYSGPSNPRTGAQIFPGWPLGSEGYGDGPGDGWRNFIVDPVEPRRVGLFQYFVFDDPKWDWTTMDWDRDVAYTTAKMGFINATSRDLSAFRSRGGKIVMHTGWVDPILPAPDVIKYYEEVTDAMGGPDKTKEFFRLFMAPGMGHCSGGPGPDTLDALSALELWVEKGVAPDTLVASRMRGGIAVRTRPLCVYPQVARWSGKGSSDDAANFACVSPRGQGS